jgi:fluoroquinolone transport system permease protein
MMLRLIRFELKNILRDRMTAMLLGYPIVFGFIIRAIIETQDIDANVISLLVVALTIMSGMIFGSMAGFSILDDRDDHVFLSIQISPMNVEYYVLFKVFFVFILSIFANILIFIIVRDTGLSMSDVIMISFVNAFQVPIHAFLVNAFASNKVEGFVAMKGAGFLIIFPIAAFLFTDWKQWLFAIAPAFWGAKATQYRLFEPLIEMGLVNMPLSFTGYLLIGLVYNLLLSFGLYRFFKHKYIA